MIRGRNIVCVASGWFDHPTSKHHVMRLLAEHNHVMWVSCHASRRPSLTGGDAAAVLRRLRQVWAGPQRVAPGIDVITPLLVPLPESPLIRWLNTDLLAARIRSALRRLPPRPVQLWLFAPDAPGLARRLDAERVVYYCVDDFAAFAGFNTELIERLERQTLAASDVVIATSQELYDARRGEHNNVHLVPHGVDYEHFAAAVDAPAPIPEDLRAIPRPIFGYFGLISEYVDLELLGQAARRRPDWSFVLLGDRRTDEQPVVGLPNVHLLGGRPYADLPAYCRGFDVGLIPFRMSRLIRAVNPIKLREYLAAGLPVVSAPMSAVQSYAPAVRTAEELDDFLAACAAALVDAEQVPPSARQKLVQAESWRSRVEWLSRIVAGESSSEQPPTLSRAG
ncbi:MAG: glycosyltransferase [Phycisphaerae bacterium]|jgi:glycosyltransferase involved in cell wall biosynthesis